MTNFVITRRGFVVLGLGVIGTTALASCGTDDVSSSDTDQGDARQDSSNSAEGNGEQAEELDYGALVQEWLDNPARAANEYDGRLVKWTAYVNCIYGDRGYYTADPGPGELDSLTTLVYLSEEDFLEINQGEEYTIVGTLQFADNKNSLFIKDAYIVQDSSSD